jgi:hypothetical protein
MAESLKIGRSLSSLSKKQNPISKITRAEKAGVVAQEVQHLPSKYETLEFKTQYCKNKQTKNSTGL